MGYKVLLELVAVLAALSTFPARADDDRELARKLQAAGEILSLEAILERAKAEKSGEVLEIDLDRKASGYVYEIEILDGSGQVWELDFDAKTGQILHTEQDD